MVDNNFFKAVRPATTLCKFFGVLPISCVENNIVVLFKYSPIYNVVLLLLSVFLAFQTTAAVYRGNIVEAITDITVLVVNELQLVVTLIKAIAGKDAWLELVYAFLKVDKLFTELGVQLPDKQLKRIMYTSFAMRVVMIASSLIVQLYLKVYVAYTEYAFVYTLLIFNNILNFCTGLCVRRLRDGFQTLNCLIKERVDAQEDAVFTVPLKDFLSSASIIHHSLTKTIKKFNQCFGIILLAAVTSSFLIIVLCLHASYRGFVNDPDAAIAASYLFFSFIYIINTFFLCHLCEVTIEKVKALFLFYNNSLLVF